MINPICTSMLSFIENGEYEKVELHNFEGKIVFLNEARKASSSNQTGFYQVI